ncbi:MAG: hypothetical protein LBU73_08835 [Helicobacteraceae bacterium]|jgi:NADH:ubiquinone oxidoreductase subunit 6 (subunit J)|nr:hypothetical protein [Helicobacteraceae bacterium]
MTNRQIREIEAIKAVASALTIALTIALAAFFAATHYILVNFATMREDIKTLLILGAVLLLLIMFVSDISFEDRKRRAQMKMTIFIVSATSLFAEMTPLWVFKTRKIILS